MSGYSDGLFGASDINCNGTSTSFTNSSAIGTVVVGASASTIKFLPIGSAGALLQSNAAADPTWVTAPSLSSLTLSTPLVATSGGTGIGSYAVGDLLAADTTTTLSKITDVATGNALVSGGVGVLSRLGKDWSHDSCHRHFASDQWRDWHHHIYYGRFNLCQRSYYFGDSC